MNNSYVFTNVKGGCGKTMLNFQMSGIISNKNYRILCIDADPQHNLTKAFLGKTPNRGLFELLNNDCDIEDIIIQPYSELDKLKNIYLLPCNYELFYFDKNGNNDAVLILRDILTKAKNENKLNYDFIFIDTNPSINILTTSVFIYAKNIIGVFDESLDSIEGFEFLEKSIIKSIQTNVNKDLKAFGMIINNNDKRNNFSPLMLKTLIKLYGDSVFDEIISPSVINKKSRAARLPLIEYDPKHPSTFQFERLVDDFLKRVGENYG